MTDSIRGVAKKPTPQKSTNDIIYIFLRMSLRNMILRKVIMRPNAAQGFAYAGDRYDNDLTKDKQDAYFRLAHLGLR